MQLVFAPGGTSAHDALFDLICNHISLSLLAILGLLLAILSLILAILRLILAILSLISAQSQYQRLNKLCHLLQNKKTPITL